MNKLNARKVFVDGEVFASRKEYRRWRELLLLQKAGEISDLKKQVKFVLIPGFYVFEPRYSEKTGKRLKDKKVCIERECAYVADFVYTDRDGHVVVEDTKGCKKGATYELFKIKRKLMLEKYGISVRET
ncbi:MAG: DUF1064 domain-containing protein [Oscillospiraceae bacterium]|nr:DUF1064 domain-containing protein [Oscillospiraceae bacterium]